MNDGLLTHGVSVTRAVRAAALAVGLLIVSSGTAAAQVNQLIPLFVSVTSSDPIGEQVAYYLKQDVVRSSQYHLVYGQNASSFTINLVTMDENRRDPGNSTVYAAALIMSRTDGYLDLWVGVCGSQRTQECAADILAGVAGDVDSLRTKY